MVSEQTRQGFGDRPLQRGGEFIAVHLREGAFVYGVGNIAVVQANVEMHCSGIVSGLVSELDAAK